ncbi:MAG: hypothetical protein GFH27_549283n163 [Chloroflexi bacterium AL-W]|nr:hypothetical protein [Chloroflexi bacterium AL-N1]NOK64716.1 hypothetical protein [Chloroflexi bacterium AL-N10]NOK75957.1 hypothetical protein [Chloroflexi bacterium AL-N5]NOK80284.1 hypothetical protein [Chloroflexi bacterium AL-W]NOK86797.1 hypothetical protein [Chloroflexi bacterium AL-N15]
MHNQQHHLYMCIMLVVCFLIIFVLVGFQAQAAPSSSVEGPSVTLHDQTAHTRVQTR